MYVTRSFTCRVETTSPQTGMYGFAGLADSPSPWSMIDRSRAAVRRVETWLSAGTSGDTPPRPSAPWHCAQANWTK